MRIRLALLLLALVPLGACRDQQTPTDPLADDLVPSLSTVDPSTPETIIAGLIAQVGDLVVAGTLSRGEGNALTSKLLNAQKSLEKDNIGAAMNQIGAFVNQVEALLNSGRLTDEGQPLIDAAETATGMLGSTAIAVDAGEGHTCAVLEGGQALCWGLNSAGQLGNGTFDDSPVPVTVSGDHLFASITLGSRHSCGLTPDGYAYCWGNNNRGELGAGVDPGTPSAVPVAVSGGIRFTQLSAGNYATCGVTPDGAAYCWGMQRTNGLEDRINVPNAIGNAVPLVSVSAGSFKACGLDAGGTAYCWGLDRGDFGNGVTHDVFLTPIVAASGETFASLYAGTRYTCGLKADGAAFCWGGDDRVGKLGLGSVLPLPYRVTEPNPVAGGHAFVNLDLNNTNWVYGHTCGVTTDGAAYCWGTNRADELGTTSSEVCPLYPDDPWSCSSTPLPVDGGIDFAFVASGNGMSLSLPHTCGLGTDGGVYCWGGNLTGQLGNGSYEGSPRPMRVDFYRRTAEVALQAARAFVVAGESARDATDTGEVGGS